MKLAKNNEVLYHVGLSRDMIKSAKYAILVDNRALVEPIARILQKDAVYIAENREYLTYLVDMEGTKVVVTSTGFGSVAMGFVPEEMGMLGITNYLRIGEIESLQNDIPNSGSFIVPQGAVRLDGVSVHYAPIIYPAAANLEWTLIIENILKNSHVPYNLGTIATYDAYYAVRNDDPDAFVNKSLGREAMKKYGVLGIDTEVACLFTMCNVFGFKTAALLDTVIRKPQAEDIEAANNARRIENWKKVLPRIMTELIRSGDGR